MQEIIVLKNTKKGLVVDTVYKSADTLKIDVTTATTLQLPKEKLVVTTIEPPKEGIELFGLWAAIIGGIAAFIAVGLSFYQLFKKDREKQAQINELANQTAELIKQTKLFDKRIRMAVRPGIWCNGSGRRGHEQEFNVQVDNRGEIAFLDKIEFMDGDDILLRNWNNTSIPIEKNGTVKITGNYGSLNPDTMNFKFKICYHDREGYKYETIYEWKGGFAKILETKEL